VNAYAYAKKDNRITKTMLAMMI